jgi:hypothetical protein
MKVSIFRLCLFFTLWFPALDAYALDREAFTFTNYDLNVRVEPEQQRLAVRGKVTLRNDSATSQKVVVLQISSSLNWRSIRAEGEALQFVSQSYTSDIDHTGALSEATVTLPSPVPPKGSIDLEIAYEGIVALDATRLTRIETPEAIAHSADWDQISTKFTAVRGVGYVTWYPIATADASLADGTSLPELVARWKTREASFPMHLVITVTSDAGEPPELLLNATTCAGSHEIAHQFVADCTYRSVGSVAPTFAIGNYEVLDHAAIAVHFLRGHEASAANYAEVAEKVLPLLKEWFGSPRAKAQTADLADADATPFESGSLLLTPLNSSDPKPASLAAAHQLTHAAFFSPRTWINEGLAHFAQALYLEHQNGRQAALNYIGSHRAALDAVESAKQSQAAAPRSVDELSQSLINTFDEELARSKAMCVWWMLRDMVGDAVLKKAIAAYDPAQDKEPSYMQHLIQAQAQKDLEWFFDDWVYRDRGLPEFKVESAFTRKTSPEGYLLTITIRNLGAAGAEVPLTVKFAGGETTKRLIVRGKSDGVIRVEVPKPPEEIVVNDGSVPERDTKNNVFKMEGGDSAK